MVQMSSGISSFTSAKPCQRPVVALSTHSTRTIGCFFSNSWLTAHQAHRSHTTHGSSAPLAHDIPHGPGRPGCGTESPSSFSLRLVEPPVASPAIGGGGTLLRSEEHTSE